MSQQQASRSRGGGNGRGAPSRGQGGNHGQGSNRGQGSVRGRGNDRRQRSGDRRGGRGGSHPPRPSRRRDIFEGLMPTDESLTIPSTLPDRHATIENLRYIGSYNWKDEKDPSIIVPGSPRLWLDPTPPFFVPPDEGILYRDQTHFRMPKTPLVPLLLCVDEVTPDFDWSSVDFVTDRNNLRKLLRALRPTSKSKDAWRIDLQVTPGTQKTILFTRWETQDTQRADGKGRGFNFEKHTTLPVEGCEGSTSHHQVICYNLGGLKIVVRFEVDAYVGDPTEAERLASKVDVDMLSLAGLSLLNPFDTKFGLKIYHRGPSKAPDLSTIAELTTSSTGRIRKKDTYAQLYLSGTPILIIAQHNSGTFTRIEKRQLLTSFSDEQKTQKDESLTRLANLLHSIKELVTRHGENGRMSLVYDGQDKDSVKIYEPLHHDSFLPEEMLRRFT